MTEIYVTSILCLLSLGAVTWLLRREVSLLLAFDALEARMAMAEDMIRPTTSQSPHGEASLPSDVIAADAGQTLPQDVTAFQMESGEADTTDPPATHERPDFDAILEYGKATGHVTYQEINERLPLNVTPEEMDELFEKLDSLGIGYSDEPTKAYRMADVVKGLPGVMGDISPGEASAHRLLQERLDAALAKLTEREEKVLRLRFGIGDHQSPRTLEEVGAIFNLSRERIRQIEAAALKKLSHPVRRELLIDFWQDS